MESQPITSIIRNSKIKIINIPAFQRPYKWEKPQITQYLNDFNIVVERDLETDYHFLGLVVYVKQRNNADSGAIDIIDGQQRLTTTFIMISVIRDMMHSVLDNHEGSISGLDLRDLNADIANASNLMKQSNGLMKLTTENESYKEHEILSGIQKGFYEFEEDQDDAFMSIYRNQDENDKNINDAKLEYLYNIGGDRRKTRHKKAIKAYKTIYEHLSEKIFRKKYVDRYKDLSNYFNTITEKFHIISFPLESYNKAFEYFEVLNDRGLEISALDLIKNFCLKKTQELSDEELRIVARDEIFEFWKEIFSETLNEEYNLILFIRYAYMSRHGHIQKKEIYPKYSKMFKNLDLDRLTKYLKDDLLSQATAFKVLLDSNESMPNFSNDKLKNIIECLKSTNTQQWFSVCLAVLTPIIQHRFNLSETNQETLVVKIFENLHEMMFVLNYSDRLANKLETKLPEIASKVDQGSDVNDYFSSLSNIDDEIVQLKGTLELSYSHIDLIRFKDNEFFEPSNNLGNMFLLLLNYKKNGGRMNFKTRTLEHVLPQSVKEEEWPEFFSYDIERQKKSIYSIGNFLNAPSGKNSSLKGLSFKQKKSKEDGYLLDPLEGTDNYFKNIDDDGWTEEKIKERQDQLIEMFKTACLEKKQV